jgi:hypothetical protein
MSRIASSPSKVTSPQVVTLAYTLLAEAGKIRSLMDDLHTRPKKYFKVDEVRDMEKALTRIFRAAEELRDMLTVPHPFVSPAKTAPSLSTSFKSPAKSNGFLVDFPAAGFSDFGLPTVVFPTGGFPFTAFPLPAGGFSAAGPSAGSRFPAAGFLLPSSPSRCRRACSDGWLLLS